MNTDNLTQVAIGVLLARRNEIYHAYRTRAYRSSPDSLRWTAEDHEQADKILAELAAVDAVLIVLDPDIRPTR